jgi:hypothetical protein
VLHEPIIHRRLGTQLLRKYGPARLDGVQLLLHLQAMHALVAFEGVGWWLELHRGFSWVLLQETPLYILEAPLFSGEP